MPAHRDNPRTTDDPIVSLQDMARFSLGWPLNVVLTCAILLGAALLFEAPVLSSAVVVILSIALPLILIYLAWQVVSTVVREAQLKRTI